MYHKIYDLFFQCLFIRLYDSVHINDHSVFAFLKLFVTTDKCSCITPINYERSYMSMVSLWLFLLVMPLKISLIWFAIEANFLV